MEKVKVLIKGKGNNISATLSGNSGEIIESLIAVLAEVVVDNKKANFTEQEAAQDINEHFNAALHEAIVRR